jgi:hypothetical protein
MWNIQMSFFKVATYPPSCFALPSQARTWVRFLCLVKEGQVEQAGFTVMKTVDAPGPFAD